MKLFKTYNVNRSSVRHKYENDVAFAYGKLMYEKDIHTTEINAFGAQVDMMVRTLVEGGKFVRFELPIAKTRTYTCPIDFVEKTGKCRPTWLVTSRVDPSGKKVVTKTFAWLPVEMLNT